ncbi:unnamed protein product, partial [Rotaria magnacalcarata]
MINSTSGIY